jgi:hypothetical protein
VFRVRTIAGGEAVALGKFGASKLAGRNKLARPRHLTDAVDTDEVPAEKSAPTTRNRCAEKQRSFLGRVVFVQDFPSVKSLAEIPARGCSVTNLHETKNKGGVSAATVSATSAILSADVSRNAAAVNPTVPGFH